MRDTPQTVEGLIHVLRQRAIAARGAEDDPSDLDAWRSMVRRELVAAQLKLAGIGPSDLPGRFDVVDFRYKGSWVDGVTPQQQQSGRQEGVRRVCELIDEAVEYLQARLDAESDGQEESPASSPEELVLAGLIHEVDGLVGQAEALQLAASTGSANEAETLRRAYEGWFGRCMNALPADLRDRFRKEREGTTWTSKIRAFLEAPQERNALYDPANPNPLLSPWRHPWQERFRAPIHEQRQLLVEAANRRSPDVGTAADDLERILSVLKRLPQALDSLCRRRRNREPFIVADEYDLQDILEAILRVHFDDVRNEERTPSAAGGSAQIDFFIPAVGLAIEAKMTRSSQSARQVGDELIADIARYRGHPGCRALVGVVLDSLGTIANPHGFEADLVSVAGELPMRVLVLPWRPPPAVR
jgi:REase_DpnII-MboI